MLQLIIILLLHAGTNLRSNLLKLLKAVQTEIRRRINQLRIILIVIRITKRTDAKTKTTIT